MSAQWLKRRARMRGKGLAAGFVLCVMGLILMVLGSARMREQRIALDRETGKFASRPGAVQAKLQTTVTSPVPALVPDMSPQRAQALLAGMAPLLLPTHGEAEDAVKSTLLCFCLLQGPATVRELRRLAAERFAQGVAAFQDAKYQAAAEAFGQAMQRHPREARAFVNRGLAYAHLGRYEAAKTDLTHAIALRETLAEAYYGRALVAVFLGDREQVQADMQHAARLGDERARRLSRAKTQSVREG
jgi:tetratricopeptide (TPR) repeat protein